MQKGYTLMQSFEIIRIFCDPKIYEKTKGSLYLENTAAVVLFSEFTDTADIDAACKKYGVEPTYAARIEDAYFARYRSPFRGKVQGPALMPLRAAEKLALRLYAPNARSLYSAIKNAIQKADAETYDIHIYTSSVIGSGFFVDCAAMADEIVRSINRKRHIRLYIDASPLMFFDEKLCSPYTHTAIEEALLASEKKEGVKTVCGDHTLTPKMPLVDDFCVFDGGGILDIEQTYKNTSSPESAGWDYFSECDWENINYNGFCAEKSTVSLIKEYEEADRDGGFHLYSPLTGEILL